MQGYFIIIAIMSALGVYFSGRLNNRFARYSVIPVVNSRSGREVAEMMLKYHGIDDVQLTEGKGFLSDHYNPKTKIVNLSSAVFHGRSLSSATVAAHEVAHAIQHAESYPMLMMRSRMVLIVKFASIAQQYLLIAVLLLASVNPQLLLLTIIAYAITTMFSFVTLPVELDASKRALAFIEEQDVVLEEHNAKTRDALKWAALTYVVSALSSFVILIFLILHFLKVTGSRA